MLVACYCYHEIIIMMMMIIYCCNFFKICISGINALSRNHQTNISWHEEDTWNKINNIIVGFNLHNKGTKLKEANRL